MARGRITVRHALERELPPGSSLILAVSGGLDSVVLLDASAALARVRKLSLRVAHVDHRLRPESPQDAEFVKSLAARRGLEFHLYIAESDPPQAGIEAWARKVRYEFFTKLREETRSDFVVTAHTANDAAETLLMRLLANREPGTIAARSSERGLLRPLLGVTRTEIERYAAARKLEHREDSTNTDTRFLRNRIRHLVIPLLEREFDPRIVEVLSNRAAGLGEDQALLRELARRTAEHVMCHDLGSQEWVRAVCRAADEAPRALRWRTVEYVMREALGYELGRTKAERVLAVIRGEQRAIELPGGYTFRRSAGRCILCRTRNAGSAEKLVSLRALTVSNA